MIPSATLRETIVLIIFGVILVPIAAKRAQDAPGYWQTFSKGLSNELSSLTFQQFDEQPVWILNSYDDQPGNAHESKHNMTLPLYAAKSTIRSRSKTSTHVAKGLASTTTIRFSIADISPARLRQASAKPVEDGHSSGAIKPPPSPATVSTTGARLAAQIKSAEPPVVVKTSQASAGCWRLVWMGSAMAAVAAFMSLC